MFSVLIGLAVSIGSILVMERFVQPQIKPRPFFHKISLMTAVPPALVYMAFFMITYRPIYSTIGVIVVFACIIIGNNAKYRILKEPLVYSDFALLRQAIRYPALYIKYIGVWRVATFFVASVAIGVAAMILEVPVIDRTTPEDYAPTLIYLVLSIGVVYSVTHGPFRKAFATMLNKFGPTADIRKDLDNLSLVVSLIMYFFIARDDALQGTGNDPANNKNAKRGARQQDARMPGKAKIKAGQSWQRPDVVVVQSESFFDARRLGNQIPPDLLSAYDRFATSAQYHGKLDVPAWGANTMRTEFAFLSGLPNEALGFNRFNPYLTKCKKPVWTIAHQLKALGYRTVCVHPFHATFFERDTVYPNLGFDLFVDIHDFDNGETFGPYVSDVSVGEKVMELLDGYDGPQFIFVITMENHGKWEEDRLDAVAGPIEPVLGSKVFGIYLRHLCNTNLMLQNLDDALSKRETDSVLCLFGDHLPSFPDLFDRCGFKDTSTDYFVWTKKRSQNCEMNISADVLNRLVLDAVLSPIDSNAVDDEDIADTSGARTAQ